MEEVVCGLRAMPPVVVGALKRLREKDVASKDMWAKLKEMEEELLDELSKADKARKDDGAVANVDHFVEKVKKIQELRAALTTQLDNKTQLAKTLYDALDHKIQYIDVHTRSVQHLMLEVDEGALGGHRKKKRKKEALNSGASDVVEVNNTLYTADPNEPVYCTCRRVSFGEMVACDNAECPTEWFHFDCVHLKEAPTTKWYCADCRPLFNR